MAFLKPLLIYIAACYSVLTAMAEPVQHCKFGVKEHPNEDIDFCMGLTMHQNQSTNSHDLYLSMTVTRYGGSALGWTSIGLGETMTGSLMFIIYGDPLSDEIPIVSIRGSTGHAQPKLVTKSDMGGADIRVLRSTWMPTSEGFVPDNPTYIATVSLVCYSCNLWPGTTISAFSTSQPWIWAWNNKQNFQTFSYDVHLLMHAHHAGNGGWGNFYLDMSRSVNTAKYPPSLPPIRPHIASIGASESPNIGGTLGWLVHNPALHLHGIFMGVAFLLLFPVGIAAMRSGSSKSFKYHWVIQLIASIFTILGVISGLLSGRPINSAHQGVGIAIASSIGFQSILGWRHHMDFLRIHRRTWISHAHLWLGRATMVAGWANLVTGMLLRGYQELCIIAMAVLVSTELLGLTFWVWWAYRRSTQKAAPEPFESTPAWKKGDDGRYFALGDSDGEDDEDEDSSESGEKSEKRKLMPGGDLGA